MKQKAASMLLFCLFIYANSTTAILKENAGIPRNSYPVSFGIPIKMGEIPNAVPGGDVPLEVAGVNAQFKVLSNWYDGSARFVLATFMQNFASNEEKTISFGRGAGTTTATQLSISDRNDTLTIQTGVITAEILKGSRFNIINRAWRGSTPIIDNSGSGGLIIKQYKDEYNDSLTYRGEALADSFIIEESGPVRTCVYVVGRFYNGTQQMKASGAVMCDSDRFKQPPPYVRFMVRIYMFTGSDEIKITTVLHNTGQNGKQGTNSGSGGPFTFTLLDTLSKTFSMCEDSPQRLWFTEFYYDFKTAIGGTKTITTENGVTETVAGSDRFSFVQSTPDTYGVVKNGTSLATGSQGKGYIDIKSGTSGLAAALKYCWEAFPKRLDVFGDTLRINLFPRDISPAKRYQQSITMYSTNTPYPTRFDSCYHLRPGAWFRSDIAIKLHAGNCNPAELSASHRNPIMPKFEDKYLHATGAFPGFYSDTLRFMYPTGSLEQRLFERKRIWSGIMYDYDMTEEPNNSGGRLRQSIWEFWGTDKNNWGEHNMGDIRWSDGYTNLHYDIGVGVLHSFLRTGHSKAWLSADLMTHRRTTQTVYHHENGHPYCDGHSNYEKDDHGTPLTSNRPTHCWSESMGLHYALSGDPFVGDAFKKSVDGAVWFIARAYSRDVQGMYVADEQIRYYGWPLLKLCSGVWYRYEPAYYNVLVHLFEKMVIPMEGRVGSGFVKPDGSNWDQMTGYFVTPLVFLYHTLKPSETVLKDSVKNMIYRIYQQADARITQRGGINLPSTGLFIPSTYTGLNRIDNLGHTDNYAFVARHFNLPEARTQGLVNAMTLIGYHQRFGGSRATTGVEVDYYSSALYQSNANPGTETKLHGKIGLHGRMMMAYEYDSLCPVQGSDGSLAGSISSERGIGKSADGLKIIAARPNPFNPSTQIQISLPLAMTNKDIRLLIYDMNGKMVREITFNSATSGIASIEWDGKDKNGNLTSTGIYLAKIRYGANTRSSTIKLSLLK